MTKLKTIKTRIERLLAIGKGDKKAAQDVLAMAKAKGAASESQRPTPEPEKTEPMDMGKATLREMDSMGMPEVGEDGVMHNVVFIRAGMNKTKRRYYTRRFLQENVDRLDKALCHNDHPTVSETAERPERSIKDLAACTENAHWDEQEDAIVGDIRFLDTLAGKETRAVFASEIVRQTAGNSIYWPFAWDSDYQEIDGYNVEVPTKLHGSDGAKFGLDFVTLPTGN